MTIVEAFLADDQEDHTYAGIYLTLNIIDRFVTYAFLTGLFILALTVVDVIQLHEMDTHEIVKMNLRSNRAALMSQNLRPVW